MKLGEIERFVYHGHNQVKKPATKLMLRLWASDGDVPMRQVLTFIGRGDKEDAMEALSSISRAGICEHTKLDIIAAALDDLAEIHDTAFNRICHAMSDTVSGEVFFLKLN